MEHIGVIIEKLNILFDNKYKEPIVLPLDVKNPCEIQHLFKQAKQAGYLAEKLSAPVYDKFIPIKFSAIA